MPLAAYVQAWVYIEHIPDEATDAEIRDLARAAYERDGKIEISDDAIISMSENVSQEKENHHG